MKLGKLPSPKARRRGRLATPSPVCPLWNRRVSSICPKIVAQSKETLTALLQVAEAAVRRDATSRPDSTLDWHGRLTAREALAR